MLKGFFAPLTQVPPLFVARSNWPPLAAFVACVLIVAASIFFFSFIYSLLPREADTLNLDINPIETWTGQLAVLAQQSATVLLVLAAVFLLSGTPREDLSLKPLPPSALAPSFLVLVLITLAYTAFVFVVAKDEVLTDLSPYFAALEADNWALLAVAVVIGAPLSEEILFRGFLFSALSKSRVGILGAVLISNTAWTALHSNYSIYGLLGVFLVGLILSWLLWRTGSLWVTIICHGLYNAIVLTGLVIAQVNGWIPVTS